ncbi:DUF3987 domain-containing protein [Shumkonia mesophila]|uniref:DUF3987 domain-containing protein n=1 Tax=Shumkonia mesophila TaxID=2838854 RepID=UPI002934EE84|nr:DUF3987 domain-containing protein [Shumkonia mesophila]
MTAILDAALDYALRGFSVVPLHGIRPDGKCTCGRANCNAPGKHPLGKWERLQTTRLTEAEIRDVFKRHPHANVGLVTGTVSNLVVVDMDGKAGGESYLRLVPKDDSPKGPGVRTGNGAHLYFRHPGRGLKNFVKRHPGLDARADGGYVVAPPSRHVSGREYAFAKDRGIDLPLPEIPAVILALFNQKEQDQPQPPQGPAAAPEARVSVKPSGDLIRYAESALASECSIVENAEMGAQENTLCTAALKIGGYVGAGLLDFNTALDALVDAGLKMQNMPGRDPWTKADVLKKAGDKVRAGMLRPRWGARPDGASDDSTPPLDIFGDTDMLGEPEFSAEAVPSPIREFAQDKAERLGVDASMIALPALAVCASALDDFFRVQPKAFDAQWTESARLWVAVVEEAGGKKTPAIDAAVAPLRTIEAEWTDADSTLLGTYSVEEKVYQARLQAHVKARAKGENTEKPKTPDKPKIRRLLVSDTTVEALTEILVDNPAGVLGVYDEIAQLIGSFDAYRSSKGTSRDRSFWLQLYNGGAMPVDRVNRGRILVPNWSLSVVGGIQPEVIRRLSGNLTADGLLARFIVIHGRQTGAGVDRPADEVAAAAYRHTLETLTGWRQSGRIVVRLSQAAQDARTRVLDVANAFKESPSAGAGLRNHLAKWDALFARLLLTYHAVEATAATGADAPPSADTLFDPVPREISGETAGMVERLMLDFLLPHAVRFYAETFGSAPDADHGGWIAGYILSQRAPVVTARDISRAYRELRDDPGALARAMDTLERAGWVVPMESGRRNSQMWWVDPRVHSIFAGRAEKERTRREAEKEKIQRAATLMRTRKTKAAA